MIFLCLVIFAKMTLGPRDVISYSPYYFRFIIGRFFGNLKVVTNSTKIKPTKKSFHIIYGTFTPSKYWVKVAHKAAGCTMYQPLLGLTLWASGDYSSALS